MPAEADSARLKQSRNMESLLTVPNILDMVTVFYYSKTKSHNHAIHCAMIPNSKVKKCLSDIGWDLSMDDGLPTAWIRRAKDGEESVVYQRYSSNLDLEAEPIIIDRQFHSSDAIGYQEINEEFRLFHNLYYDKYKSQYIKLFDSGDEETIAIVEENNIKIRLKEILQFLSIKEMHLSIQFDYDEHSLQAIEDIGLSTDNNRQVRTGDRCYAIWFGNQDFATDYIGYSKLMGKILIPPFPKSKSGMPGFAEEKPKEYQDFIIDVDKFGENVKHTCNPDLLSDYFGGNKGAPHYLTTIQFKKNVLQKYRNEKSIYSINTMSVERSPLWNLPIDNEREDRVCVFLGDLGRYLPYEEQSYWQSFNIPSDGKLSDEYYKSQILNDWNVPTKQLRIIFKERYDSLGKICSQRLGRQILEPLAEDDHHLFSDVHIPDDMEARGALDKLVMAIFKILVESINVSDLDKNQKKRRLAAGYRIDSLKKDMQKANAVGYEKHIYFLHELKKYRNLKAAHRSDGSEIYVDSYVECGKRFLENANEFLQFLEQAVKDGKFDSLKEN